MAERAAPDAGRRTVEPVRQPAVALLRLLLVLLYSAPLTAPVLAGFAHSVDHMAAAHDTFLSALTGEAPAAPLRPHAHPHAGSHRHAGADGHGVAVVALLAASDALTAEAGDAADSVTPLRLPVHVPGAVFVPPVAADRGSSRLRDRSLELPSGRDRAPPTPPPRTAALLG